MENELACGYPMLMYIWLSEFVDNAFSGLIKFQFAISLVSIVGRNYTGYTYRRAFLPVCINNYVIIAGPLQ